ncbi:MAG: efflux RND transporter periplasmic adaptor subunit [Acidobacteria bacterium]|nr:efflux RND transporter periplasmic adaptor subunit [Acidobacteriota bacterium]
MKFLISFCCAVALGAQSLATVTVISKPTDRTVTLTAEIQPYQTASLMARVPGYLEAVEVDRGSMVRKGQTIAKVTAPELLAQIAEATAKISTVDAQIAEARARLSAAESTAVRLEAASRTAGAIAANELIQARAAVDAAKATIASLEASRRSAELHVKTLKDLEAFLILSAPFDGVVTERMLHPGSLVGPAAGPIVKLEQLNRLRVVVAVPELNVASVRLGQKVSFSAVGLAGEVFSGTVARVARTLDVKTRTMPVELEVSNPGGKLLPGMYTEVKWPAKVGQAAILVPVTAVTSTTERSFVIRVESGVTKYVNVRKGAVQGELVEVSGPLQVGDRIIQRATDEIREGTAIPAR